MTIPVSIELFNMADTPKKIAQMDNNKLELLIKKIGFFRKKAKTLQQRKTRIYLRVMI